MTVSTSESASHDSPSPEDRQFYDSTTALKTHAVAILSAFHELIDRKLADNCDRSIIQMLAVLRELAEDDMEMAIEIVLGPEMVIALQEELAHNNTATQTNHVPAETTSIKHR